MGFTTKERAECQNILEALSEFVDGTRKGKRHDVDVDQWKRELASAEDDINMLKDAFHKMSLGLKRDRNQYVPVNRLLDEILIEIWSYHNTQDRLSASQVCRKWRAIALPTAKLWTTIDMEANQVKVLRRLIERSGDSPLNVVVGIKRIGKGKTMFGFPIHPHSMSYYNSRNMQPDPFGSSVFDSKRSVNVDPENMPFLTQKEFNEILGRCATLDAMMEGSNPYYVTPKILNTPMRHLKTLRLLRGPILVKRSSPDPTPPPVAAEDLPFPLFGNVLPNLRKLCFEDIHARWDDPIYSNLTNLRICNPFERASVHQMLRILRSCPRLTDLELTDAVLPYVPPPIPNPDEPPKSESLDEYNEETVDLPHLQFLHFECAVDTYVTDFVTFLCATRLKSVHIDAAGLDTHIPTSKPCTTDPTDHPFFHFLPLMEQPTYICLSERSDYFTIEARGRLPQNVGHHPFPEYEYDYYDDAVPVTGPGQSVGVMRPVDEAGHWCYVSCTSADARYIGDHDGDGGEWLAAAHTMSFIQPLFNHNPISANEPYFHRTMNVKTITLSHHIIDLLECAIRQGIQPHHVKKFQFKYSTILPDFLYRDLFGVGMFDRIEKLKMSYNRGVGVLKAVIKGEMLPLLEEVYLIDNEVLPMVYTHPSFDMLADWVEVRMRAATVTVTGTGTTTEATTTTTTSATAEATTESAIAATTTTTTTTMIEATAEVRAEAAVTTTTTTTAITVNPTGCLETEEMNAAIGIQEQKDASSSTEPIPTLNPTPSSSCSSSSSPSPSPSPDAGSSSSPGPSPNPNPNSGSGSSSAPITSSTSTLTPTPSATIPSTSTSTSTDISRNANASANVNASPSPNPSSTHIHIRPLSKLVVDVRLDRLILERPARRRILAAMGDKGQFIWKRTSDSGRKMERFWEDAVKIDGDSDADVDADGNGNDAGGHADANADMDPDVPVNPTADAGTGDNAGYVIAPVTAPGTAADADATLDSSVGVGDDAGVGASTDNTPNTTSETDTDTIGIPNTTSETETETDTGAGSGSGSGTNANDTTGANVGTNSNANTSTGDGTGIGGGAGDGVGVGVGATANGNAAPGATNNANPNPNPNPTPEEEDEDDDEFGDGTDGDDPGLYGWTLGRDIKHKWTGGPW